MKTNFKRLFALVLTLCMLATLMVPVAFAEDEATDSTSANVAETYPIRLKDLANSDANAAVEGTLDYLMTKDAVYKDADGNLIDAEGNPSDVEVHYRKWDYDFTAKRFSSAYTSKLLNWDVYGKGGAASYKEDRAWQVRVDGGAWAAVKIRVSNPGEYALSIISDRNEYENWTNSLLSTNGTVSAYIIPLSVADAAESVADLMVDRYYVGSDDLAAEDTSVTFESIRMDCDEYVVVFNSTATRYSISEMTLTGEAYAKENVASYALRPYDVTKTDPATYTGTYNADLIDSSTTDETTGETTYTYVTKLEMSQLSSSKGTRYAALGWQYVGASTGWVRAAASRAWQPASNTKNANVAIKINVPASGAMYLSLVTDKSASVEGAPWTYSASTWAGKVTAYLVPADDYVDIATAAVDANCIGTKSLLARETTVTFDKTYLNAGEYVFIYSASVALYPVCELNLDRLSVDQAPEKADVQITETYNLALYNESDPVYSKASSFASNVTLADGTTTTLRSYVADAYEAGNLNWKLENYADAYTDSMFILRKSTGQGLRINNPTKASTGDWFAIRMRVPQGGYYSIAFSADGAAAGSTRLYMFPAEAEEMTQDQIAEQITPENAIHRSISGEQINTDKISLGYLDGEYIIVSKTPDSSKDRQIHLSAITLESEAPLSAEDVQIYNFNFFDETNPYYSLINDRYEAVVDEETGTKTYQPIAGLEAEAGSNLQSYKGAVISRDEEGNITAVSGENYVVNDSTKTYYVDDAIYKSDASGYPNTYNWRPDYTNGTGMKSHEFYNLKHIYTSSGKLNGTYNYRLNAPSDSGVIASFMLHVDKAGTYDLSITSNYSLSYAYDIYFVDTLASYSETTDSTDVDEYIADDTWHVGDGATTIIEDTFTVGQVTVDAAGDFLLVFKNDETNKDFYLENITLTPVVEDVAAGFGGETYASLQDALDAAATEGGTVHLLDAVSAQDVNVPAGVTLNLNGQTVYADSLDAAGNVIDTLDGQAAVYVDEVAFEVDNPQLPLLDKTTGAYSLYNVEVNPVTITGASSTSPKYWFQVIFSNKDALESIGASTELRVQASVTVGETVALAGADAAFSASWADKYAANDSVYITVSAINAEAAYTLAPQVAANGVVIAGSAMELPVAE